MFEKEAIRHAFEDTIGVECLIKPVEDFTYEELSDEQQEKAYDFKKGAEFGYNRAFVEADFATIAYMQGAERYKTKWHKVADGDYPPSEKGGYTINVLTDCGNIAYYNYDLDCWVAEPASVEIDPPVAWCEIPKYKE